MIPAWLNVLSIVSLSVAAVCSAIVLIDLVRYPQEMPIMNWVWPITALYGGPLALWMYARLGRPASQEAIKRNQGRMAEKPFYSSVAVSATHCGAGASSATSSQSSRFSFTGFTILGSTLAAEFAGDYVLAYAFGIAFQFFAIVPMRHLSLLPGLRAAVKADTFSLTAFEIGLFGWMSLSFFVLFHPPLMPNQPAFWFMMQLGMVLGFLTSYPANWLLIRRGVKEAM
ncbi:MAG: DUF4396 domain-containing protein [Candidatus Cybelea sp.]